ncbi:unnamed protein product, partial [Amoebophrya sp. A25]|eukprot:GSA25T00019981001.1
MKTRVPDKAHDALKIGEMTMTEQESAPPAEEGKFDHQLPAKEDVSTVVPEAHDDDHEDSDSIDGVPLDVPIKHSKRGPALKTKQQAEQKSVTRIEEAAHLKVVHEEMNMNGKGDCCNGDPFAPVAPRDENALVLS